MTYTEIKLRNENRYYYRASSVREGKKVTKQRIYLGKELKEKELSQKESEADTQLRKSKTQKALSGIIPIIIRILKKNKVKKASLFGSYARGEQIKKSDIDIIVEPPKGIGLKFVDIVYELEDALGKKVDLLTYEGINPLIKKYIAKDEVVLYG